MKTVLKAKGITKTFPGVKALDKVDFELYEGEVHALVGENGAGKSTLMYILGGVLQPDSGDIYLEDKKVEFENAHIAAMHGISVVYQEFSLVPKLSVAENIFVNRQPISNLNMIKWDELYIKTANMLKLFDVNIDPRTMVKDLSIANQQVVEILKAMSYDPKVLVLDEPTSCLTEVETRNLFKNIQKLKQSGISIIYISHHLQEIFQIADQVTILRDGKYIATKKVTEVDENDLVSLMVGRQLNDVYGSRQKNIGNPYFKVEHLSRKGIFEDISFEVQKGEILGVAGLIGAGRSEVARAIFGVEPPDQGCIFLEGNKIQVNNPKRAIKHGIAYLTEDRKNQGLYLNMAYRENLVAPQLDNFCKTLGFLDEKKINNFAEDYKKRFRIATPDIKRQVRNLSGGNQQKVLLSMWVGISPKLLIVDEPTRGVDIGARSDIYQILRHLADQGIGIVMISSDLPEVLGLSDRILVMREGRIVSQLLADEATEEKIIAAATGVKNNGN